MIKSRKAFLARLGALSLVLATAGCQSSDVIAPDGSTISLTANPSTIVLSGGVQIAPVTVIATVSNSIGVPLPGQDVRFTTTAGTLDPVAGSAVASDSSGNATTVLTDARQPPTITAKSGKATATLQIQTATCSLATLTISPAPIQLNTCNDIFNITAEALDTTGAPCVGVLVSFTISSSATTDVGGSFNPSSDSTDQNGIANTVLTINSSDCNTKCAGKACTGSIKATSGSVVNNPNGTPIVDNVP